MNEMKTFGEFLVDQGIMSTEKLLEVMISQIKETPSVSEIVYQQKLLEPDQVVKVISLQSKQQNDFGSAAKILGFWSNELEGKLFQYLEGAQKSLPEKLLENKVMDYDQLNKLLDSYLASVTVTAPISLPTKITMAPPDLFTEESVEPIDLPAEILVFAEQFDENVHDQLLVLFDKINETAEHPVIMENLHRIAGAARFAKLERLHEIFSSMELKFGGICHGGMAVDLNSCQKFVSVSLNTLPSIWSLRNHVLKTGGEEGFHQTNPPMSQILDLYLKYLHGVRND